jgi:GPH family glycoside/pentoside/hexuronide:cation symporter
MPTRHLLAYGILGLPLSFAALPIYIHVPHFYTQTTNLTLALLGAILFGARLMDALIDPWLGWLADHVSRSKMFMAALLPFVLGFLALFHPSQHYPALWLCGALALTYLGFSAAMIAHQAWGAQLGENSQARTRLTAAREGFTLLGVVLAAMLPTLLASDQTQGIARLSWLLPPLLMVIVLVGFSQLGNSKQPVMAQTPVLSGMRHVWADKVFRRLLLVFVANGIASALPATLFLFFVADILQAESVSGALLGLYFITGALSLPIWVRLSARYGRTRVWLAAMCLSVVAFAGTSLLGAGDVIAFALICLASGGGLGADLALPAAMAADQGERQGQAGTYFGVWNFVGKLNLALAAGLALPMLGLFGYIPGGSAALPVLSVTYALLPLVFKVLAGVLLWRWRHSLEIRS